MTALAEHLDRYLAVRRAVGYRLIEPGRVLPSFVAYLDAVGESTLTSTAAVAWACQSSSDAQAARRLSMVRRFAQYLSAFDAATEIPPPRLGLSGGGRRTPYLYSAEDVQALLDAALALEPELWAASMSTLVGLLSASGIRPGEAYRLDRDHVDVEAGQLAVMDSKFGRSRQLPLHPTTVAALAGYARLRDRTVGPTQSAFLVTATGRRMTRSTAGAAFRGLRAAASIAALPGRRAPRLYDFRHSFAVSTMLGWHRDGVDVQRRLPVLSAYLGHIRPENTYWYLEAAPELTALAAGRLAQSWEGRA